METATIDRPRPQEIEKKVPDSAELLARLEKLDFTMSIHSKEVRKAFREHNRLILAAETGSGKSTVAPGLFLAELLQDNPDAKMLVTQPRRVATKHLSDRVGDPALVGPEFVDYKYKDHPIGKPDARIEFTVEQSLINMLDKNQTLEGYDAVMIDEVHGRTASIDILLPYLKQAQALRKAAGMKQLKVVLASGTIDVPKFTDYFNSDQIEDMYVQRVEGRQYNVVEHFSDREFKAEEMPKAAAQKAFELVADPKKTGDILIFMPGGGEIDRTMETLDGLLAGQDVEVIKIMGGKNEDAYAEIFKERTAKRRIYVSTNVAETSLTIDGIKMVIDTGLVKKKIYDKDTRFSTLQTMDHTKANWGQRKGRAGRKEPGEAYALFTEAQYNTRKEHQEAEILHSDLAPQILRMIDSGRHDVRNFDYVDHPDPQSIDNAIESLQKLGALDKSENITPRGKEMLDLELENDDPHLARMLVEAKQRNCLDAVALLAGFMDARSVFKFDKRSENFAEKYGQYIDPQSDYITYLNIWNDYVKNKDRAEEWAEGKFNLIPFYVASRARKNIKRGKDEAIDLNPEKKRAISMSIAAGLGDRLVVFDNNHYKFTDGRAAYGLSIDKASAIFIKKPDAFLSWRLRSSNGKTYLSMNHAIDRAEIYSEFPYLAPEKIEPKTETAVEKPIIPPATSESEQRAREKVVEELNRADIQKVENLEKENPPPADLNEAKSAFQRLKNSITYLPRKIADLLRRIGRRLTFKKD